MKVYEYPANRRHDTSLGHTPTYLLTSVTLATRGTEKYLRRHVRHQYLFNRKNMNQTKLESRISTLGETLFQPIFFKVDDSISVQQRKEVTDL